jgi:sulfur carrier protein
MIGIIVNGEKREIKENMSVSNLLKELQIEQKTMAAAINMEVVKKENWETVKIKSGDKVEFLHFVGGG